MTIAGFNEISNLPNLPYPVYFVCPEVFARFPELAHNNPLPEDLQQTFSKCVSGTHIWAVETYIFLKQRGLNVFLVPKPVPGKICIVPYHELKVRDFPFMSYIVACRLDSARPEICEQQTVLNQACIRSETDHFIPQWPQPCLIPRNPERGSLIKKITFKGTLNNLAPQFRDQDFIAQLNRLGIQLEVTPDYVARHELFDYWRNYESSDLVLAVRWMTLPDFYLKPPIKLLNSWLAGCPALLGPEPAYRSLRKSELDYFEVRTPKDVLSVLTRLQEEPELYSAMIKNGLQRAQEFSFDAIAVQWHEFLVGPVTRGYEKWKNQSIFNKYIGRPLVFIDRAKRHRAEREIYLSNRENGLRTCGIMQKEAISETHQIELIPASQSTITETIQMT